MRRQGRTAVAALAAALLLTRAAPAISSDCVAALKVEQGAIANIIQCLKELERENADLQNKVSVLENEDLSSTGDGKSPPPMVPTVKVVTELLSFSDTMVNKVIDGSMAADFCVLSRMATGAGPNAACMVREQEGAWVLSTGAGQSCNVTCFGIVER